MNIKKIAALVLAVIMLVGAVPVSAFAEGAHTVTFVTEHGTAPEPVEVPDEGTIEQALNGSVGELYLPETDGYIFEYWATPEGEAFGFDTPIISDLELHAVWSDGNEFGTGLEVSFPKIYIGEPVGTYDLGSDSFGGGVHTEVNASETEVYEAGTEYTVRVRFVTDPSYYFPNGGNIPLSVIEDTPEWSTYMVSPVDYGRTYAEYEFTLVPVEREEISEISFGEITAYEGRQVGDVATLNWSSMGYYSFDILEETYEAGREYMLTMHIFPDWGMVFANGGDIPIYCDQAPLEKVSYNANEIVVQVPVTALSVERLNHIDLTFNAAAGDEVSGPYDFFTSNDVWYTEYHGFADGTEVPQYYSPGAAYSMYVSVRANAGIGFSDDVTVSVNGQTASVDRDQSDVNRIYVVFEFTPEEPVTHELRFVLPGGWPGAPDPVQVRHGMTLAQSACPQDQMAVEELFNPVCGEGQCFNGWYLDEGFSEPFDYYSSVVTDDLTLYGQIGGDYSNSVYTVTFDANGHGEAPAPAEIMGYYTLNNYEIENGSLNMSAEGYIFAGWALDPDGNVMWSRYACFSEYQSSLQMTLYAVWLNENDQFTVTFNENGHGTAPEAVTVSAGSTYNDVFYDSYGNMVTPGEETGYGFDGWFLDEAGAVGINNDDVIPGDVILYARWTKLVLVTYDAMGHGETPEPAYCYPGSCPLPPLQEDGYYFAGWYWLVDGEKTYEFGGVTEDVTLYADWYPEGETVHVTFVSEGHGEAPAAVDIQRGMTLWEYSTNVLHYDTLFYALENDYENGFRFAGWSTDPEAAYVNFYDTAIRENTTLYAVWEPDDPTIFYLYGWWVHDAWDNYTGRPLSLPENFRLMNEGRVRVTGYAFAEDYEEEVFQARKTYAIRVTFETVSDYYSFPESDDPGSFYLDWGHVVEMDAHHMVADYEFRPSPIPVQEITLDADEFMLQAGETHQLTAAVSPENAEYDHLAWQSSDTNIVTVEDGLLTAVSPGTATVSVHTCDEYGNWIGPESYCRVTVPNAMSGTWGENLTWEYTGDLREATLTIGGTGDMQPGSDGPDGYPWYYGSAFCMNESGSIVGPQVLHIVIGEGVTSVADYAFWSVYGTPGINGHVVSLELPSTLQRIGSHAFRLSFEEPTALTLPESLTSLGDWPFEYGYYYEDTNDGNVSMINIPAGVTEYGAGIYHGLPLTEIPVFGPGMTRISENMFSNCAALENAVVPEQITEIADLAFNECINLRTVSLPGTLASIGNHAFNRCSSLETIYFDGTEEQWHQVACDLELRGGVQVIFRSIPVESITLNADTLDIPVKGMEQLTAAVLPEDASDRSVVWSSSDESVASVNANGVIQGVSAGTAVITAAANDGSGIYASCTVTVHGKCQVTYDMNRTGGSVITVRFNYGSEYGENIPTSMNGETFAGWYTQPEGGTEIVPSDICTSDITLYAHWIPAPSDVISAESTSDGILIRWTKNELASGYTVWRQAEGSDWQMLTGIDDAETLEYADRDVEAGTAYAYRVRALNANGNAEPGAAMTVTFRNENHWTSELVCADVTYGAQPAPAAEAAFGEVVFTYSTDEQGPFTADVPAAAGEYFVRAEVADSAAYTGLTATVPFTIHKAVYDMSGVSFANASFVYDGTGHGLEVTGEMPEGVTVRYIGNAQTNVGEYSVQACFTGDPANYELIGSMTATMTIVPAENSWTTELSCADITYGQTPAPQAAAAHGEAVFTYGTSADGEFTADVPVNAGTYYVRAEAAADNYTALSATASFEIRKAVYDMSGVTFADVTAVYDGEAHDPAVAGTLPEGVTVTYTGNGQTEVGEYTVTAHFSGDTVNHEPIADMTASLVITPAQNSWTTELSCADITYGQTPAPQAAAAHGEVVFTYGTSADGEFTADVPVNAGTYYVRAEAAAGNYTGLSAVTSFEIRKAVYDMSGVTFADVTAPYDGEAHDLAVAGTLPEGVTVTYTGNGQKEVGTYTVTAVFTGNTVNHEPIADMTASLVITKGQNSWTTELSCADVTYGQTPAPQAAAAHGTAVYTYSTSESGPFVSEVPEAAGTYYVQAVVEAENYEALTAVRSFSIRKAVYDMSGVTFADTTVAYDGEAHDLTITGTLPEGVTARYIGNGRVETGAYPVIARFSGDRENYEPIPEMEAELVIETADNSWTTELTCADVPFGSAPAPNAAAAHGTPVYTYSTEENGEFTEEAPTGIGRYFVRAEVPGDDHYRGLSAVVPFRIQFTDVNDPAASNYDPVYWAVEEGITNGWADGTFRPWNTCNRASVITFLWRLAGRPQAGAYPFSDPTGNADFDAAITWGAAQGIVGGYSDNTFRPWNTCNRASVVTFLWRYLGRPSAPAGYEASFSDLTNNADFNAAISWAAGSGITTGYSDNTFRPWNTCNRSQIVIFLYRMEHPAG